MKKDHLLIFMLILAPLVVMGQSTIEMADAFRADGKIYVVIAVFGVLLAGFFIYLFSIDKKISKMENDHNQSRNNEPSRTSEG